MTLYASGSFGFFCHAIILSVSYIIDLVSRVKVSNTSDAVAEEWALRCGKYAEIFTTAGLFIAIAEAVLSIYFVAVHESSEDPSTCNSIRPSGVSSVGTKGNDDSRWVKLSMKALLCIVEITVAIEQSCVSNEISIFALTMSAAVRMMLILVTFV